MFNLLRRNDDMYGILHSLKPITVYNRYCHKQVVFYVYPQQERYWIGIAYKDIDAIEYNEKNI